VPGLTCYPCARSVPAEQHPHPPRPAHHRPAPLPRARTARAPRPPFGTGLRALQPTAGIDIREHAAARAEHHERLHAVSLAHNPHLCAQARSALSGTVERAHPARVVIYTPPLSPSYLRLARPTSTCGLAAYAAELARAHPAVVYFDDRSLGPFTDDSGLFLDSDHLSLDGARTYSEILRTRLFD
jgi:hypothetical protein